MESCGSETAAIQVLKRAIQLDGEKKFSEAVTCYEQGIRLLVQAAKETTKSDKKSHFRKVCEQYLSRAEILKEAVKKQKEASKNHKQIRIVDGQTGYSYDAIFGPLIDEILTEVEVDDAYIRSIHQTYNFLRLCELFVKKAPNLKKIVLHTTPDTDNYSKQNERLNEITQSLAKYQVQLDIQLTDTLHDREIRMNNGWIVKIGRGLDYFKKTDGKFSIGFTDYDLRRCYETTIDIYPTAFVQNS